MSRCNHWTNPPASTRCSALADVLLLAPEHDRATAERVIGPMCRPHADACSAEYHEKLGEEWRIEPLDRIA